MTRAAGHEPSYVRFNNVSGTNFAGVLSLPHEPPSWKESSLERHVTREDVVPTLERQGVNFCFTKTAKAARGEAAPLADATRTVGYRRATNPKLRISNQRADSKCCGVRHPRVPHLENSACNTEAYLWCTVNCRRTKGFHRPSRIPTDPLIPAP